MHFWPREQKMIQYNAFLPFFAFFVVANFYYIECMFRNSAPLQGIWLSFYANENFTATNADVLDIVEPKVFALFCLLFFPQVLSEVLQMAKSSCSTSPTYKCPKWDYIDGWANLWDLVSIIFNSITLILRR